MPSLTATLYSELRKPPSHLLELPSYRPLEFKSDTELERRFFELVNSSWIINEEGEPVPFILPEMQIWRALTITFREMVMRRLPLEEVRQRIDREVELEQKSVKGRLREGHSPLMVGKKPGKFGKREHLQKFLDRGEFWINPASSFLGDNLTDAQKDNELVFEHETHPSRTSVSFFNKLTGKQEKMDPIGTFKHKSEMRSDFYLSCFTNLPNARLFFDFKADSCFVFKKPEIFLQRLRDGLKSKLPGWGGVKQFVDTIYTDRYDMPFSPKPFISKDVKYHYQWETRLFWFPAPNKTTLKLETIKLELGSMHDIGELINLDE